MACKICGCPAVRWLRVTQIASQFRCSGKRVRRLIKRGDLDAVRFGGEWRVDHESLDELVRRDGVRLTADDRTDQALSENPVVGPRPSETKRAEETEAGDLRL